MGDEMVESRGAPRFVRITYDGKWVGKRAHLLLPLDREHGPGKGWHTACNQLWADGPRTQPGQWGHRFPGVTQRCASCIRAISGSRVSS